MAPSSTSNSPCKAPACRGGTLYLISNNEVFRTALAANLRDDGHTVLELCEDDLPQDTRMHGAGMVIADDGLLQRRLLRWLRAACRMLPVVVLTAEPVPVWPAGAGAVRLLHKPVHYDDLHGLVHQLLSEYRVS